jgi:C1A family cysteine protease
MRYMKTILFLLLPLTLHSGQVVKPQMAGSSETSAKSQLVVNMIWEQILSRVDSKTMRVSTTQRVGGKSRGEKIVEAQKEKVRAQIAKKYGSKEKLSGAEKVQLQLAQNRAKLKKLRAKQKKMDGLNPYESAMAEMKEEADRGWEETYQLKQKWITEVKKEYFSTIEKWKKESEEFNKRASGYSETLERVEVPSELAVAPRYITKVVETPIKKQYHLIPSAMSVPIRDQAQRATCSSFAGVRAMEILLHSYGRSLDLSEQYFYWASKPDCRDSKCTTSGSWVGYGLEYTRDNSSKWIPTESQCPYVKSKVSGNETQIPLKSNCSNGLARAKKFHYLKTLDEVIKSLDQNRPVIAGSRLSKRFYRNEGLVLLSEKDQGDIKLNSHSGGHSYLFVGYMTLPPELHQKEGKLCFIVANSWGEGWGVGGHSCLSEKWILHHRQTNPFTAIEVVELK